MQWFPEMLPEFHYEPVIKAINTWIRVEVARSDSLVQLLDGDVQLKVLPLILVSLTQLL
jgi:hypothetical protein